MIYLPTTCPVCHVDMEVCIQDGKDRPVVTAKGKCGGCGAIPTYEVRVSVTYTLGSYLRDASILFLCPKWAICSVAGHSCEHADLHTLANACTMYVDGECPDCALATSFLEDSASVVAALANFRFGNTISWERIRDALLQEMEEDQAEEEKHV